MLNCLVTGVGPVNKGAELMLMAINAHFIKKAHDRRLVLDTTCGGFEWRSAFGGFQLLEPHRLGKLGRFRTMFFHEGYRMRFGMVSLDDIDLLLDASGFAFGDSWKPEWINASASRFEAARRAGALVVLMPQAFGPVTLPKVVKGVERVLASADLVFARDRVSYDNCKAHMDRHDRLALSPDFTNLVEPARISDWPADRRRVGIVPNMQLLRQGALEFKESYLPQMRSAINQVLKHGLEPWVIVHESNDLGLCTGLATEVGISNNVIECQRADEIKYILGKCRFVIGSRFHGLISSLSQSIPSVCLSWSHKYEELFDDYGIPELVFRPGNSKFHDAVESLLDERQCGFYSELISKKSIELRHRVCAMWNTIELLIEQRI